MPAQCSKFAEKVSASEGNWRSENAYGCVGAFQFCPGTFEKYYGGTKEEFKSNPSAQVAAWTQYQKDEWSKAQTVGSTSLIGKQVCYDGSCFTVDQSSILFACQFGCGKGGKLYNLVQNGGQCVAPSAGRKSSPTNDGNGVCVAAYLKKGVGYDASCFTGQSNSSTVCAAPGPNMPKGDYPTVPSAAASALATTAPSPHPNDIVVGSGMARLDYDVTYGG